jgi:hypothetical protein
MPRHGRTRRGSAAYRVAQVPVHAQGFALAYPVEVAKALDGCADALLNQPRHPV